MSQPRENGMDNTRSFTPISKGTMISHYKIIEKIGAGGMGEVYLAEDTELNREVALKFLPPHLCQDEDCRKRFKREAQAAAVLEHPNIVTIYEVSEHQGRPYIVMQYVEGKSLRDIIKEKELPIDEIIDLAIQICEGLSKAHEAGVIHRDIKPSNICIGSDGRPKLLDFGLAAVKGDEKLTKTGSTLGTIGYMSPEQIQGKQLDQRSDIFSLGVVLYEMIAGRPPFRGETEAATMKCVLTDTPEPLARYKADVPDELQRIVDEALDKDLGTRYQTASGLVADLMRLKKASEVPSAPPPLQKPRWSKIKRLLITSSAVAAVVLLILILKPWRFELRPTQEAVAAENRLAIMYFDNLAEPEDNRRLGEIVTSLLITDLSESRYVQVVSSQRLYDILKLLGKEGTKMIDGDVASKIARKAKAKWMLLGNILQVEPEIILTAQLVEVATGNAIASQRITGDTDEKIFSLVDKLTVEIKRDLALPAAAQEEPDWPIADVTTNSPEAYRYYLEGVDYDFKYYWLEAQKSFRKALEFDSTFAMAYYGLSRNTWFRASEQKELIAKAVEYSDKVSWKERQYIKAQEAFILQNYEQRIAELQKIIERYPQEKTAFYLLGGIYQYNLQQHEEAVHQYTKAIEIDPLYKVVYNELAYAYDKIGDFEKSIWAINKYISLAPDEANPYDSKGDLYAFNGQLDRAIESYKNALEIKPDFYMSWFKLGHMYLFKREYAKAESCYQQHSSSSEKDTRSQGREFLAIIPLYQGKFNQALDVLDDGLAADRMEQAEGSLSAEKHILKAFIYEEKKNLKIALKEIEEGMEVWHRAYPDNRSGKVYGREYYVKLLAENKDFEKAEEVARALKEDLADEDQTWMYYYWVAAGSIELSKGNLEASLTNFEKAAKVSTRFYAHFILGKTYLESGRLGEAVAELEKALSRYDDYRLIVSIWSVKAHYLLGLAYEKSGWNREAIEKYEEFLEIWKDADPGIAEVEDARERLARLKKES